MKQSAACETHFLGWDAPLLPAAARFLCDRSESSDLIDLRKLLCVLPSARSSADLKGQLEGQAARRNAELYLPEIVTIGELAEKLYQPSLPVALELEQTLAWATVLQAMAPEDLRPLIPVVPEQEPIGPWVDFGGTLRRLHELLSANLLSFEDVGQATETDGERKRWKLLAQIFNAYLSELSAAKLCDPNVARRQAVADGKCGTDKTVTLIGTSDLSDAMIGMLQSLESDVLSLIAAPESESKRFDSFGCVVTSEWMEHHLPVADDHFITAGDISDQSRTVAEAISRLRQTYRTGQITVGVTDESHVGPVEVELRGIEVPAYRHLGWTLSETAIGRLMNLVSTHLRRQTWQSLAALVRHSDVCAMVGRKLDAENTAWLTELDNLLADHFPVRLRDDLPPRVGKKFLIARDVANIIQGWLADLDVPQQTIAEWSQAFSRCLKQLYENRLDIPGRERTAMAVEKATQVLERFANLNADLDMSIGSAAAIDMLTGRLSDVRFGEALQDDDVEIAGWLDLALDTSPAMIVLGMNHPFVPATVTADPFLPGALRTKLRMADNDRRYARDAYAAHLMLSTRPDTCFIVGRNSADGSPTPPSRLVAAAPAKDSARRVLQLLDSQREPVEVDHRWNSGPQHTNLPIPKLDAAAELPEIKSMSVTAFANYLTCPYRFYLRHVLKCTPLDDSGNELAANQFGDLIHNALDLYGNDKQRRDESDPEKIKSVMIEYLHDYAAERYGDSATTSVALQVAQAERRLEVVAQRQAERIADGWYIRHAEISAGEKQGSGLDVDGQWMTINGRIDRVDYHPETGRWAILDYKTHGKPPEKTHFKNTKNGIEWMELQLPLYRIMARYLGIDVDPNEIELGYFNISQKDSETKINIADFGEDLGQQAQDEIFRCIRDIRAGKFEPSDKPVMYDDYAMILQTGVAN